MEESVPAKSWSHAKEDQASQGCQQEEVVHMLPQQGHLVFLQKCSDIIPLVRLVFSHTWLVCTPMQVSSNGLSLKSLDRQGSYFFFINEYLISDSIIMMRYLSINPSSFTFLSQSGHCCQVGPNIYLGLRWGLPVSVLQQCCLVHLIICPIQLKFERGRGPEVWKGWLQALVAEAA